MDLRRSALVLLAVGCGPSTPPQVAAAEVSAIPSPVTFRIDQLGKVGVAHGVIAEVGWVGEDRVQLAGGGELVCSSDGGGFAFLSVDVRDAAHLADIPPLTSCTLDREYPVRLIVDGVVRDAHGDMAVDGDRLLVTVRADGWFLADLDLDLPRQDCTPLPGVAVQAAPGPGGGTQLRVHVDPEPTPGSGSCALVDALGVEVPLAVTVAG